MKPGPPPTPTRLRLLRGNRSRRPVNHDEPQPEPLDLSTPSELMSAESKAEWLRVIVPLIELGVITNADRCMALAHCETFATWRAQLKLANTHPEIVAVGRNKYPIGNPARTMANRSLQLLARIDSELGLTPASRSRVVVPKGSARQSAVEAFRRRKAPR